MWKQPEDQDAVCKWCEDKLKCGTCKQLKTWQEFSLTQARKWNCCGTDCGTGDYHTRRRCKECIKDAETATVEKKIDAGVEKLTVRVKDAKMWRSSTG